MKSSESTQEPIAIIGMGCRFPGGVDSPATFWELLKSGLDGIIEIPSDRWNIDQFYDSNPATPGKMYVRAGGFLTQKINEFDALFFGISPREAGYIDPQQRLLMEVTWEALEDAGLVPEQLAGSDTGVYIGGFMLDNFLTQFSPLNREQIGSHSAVGSTLTILSNRLSYIFDFRGPSISMDTACSSSLVAAHVACQSIWRGECTLALCGGVNIMHRPENPIAMCKGGFLSPDGRSKSFDMRADGYGRGEGAGIVVLKPYSAAVRDGDDIYGLVRGTGANQDGRTDGITVPNPAAQEALMRKVCFEARVDPGQIRYVEAHGTGTPVGDPLEAGAIGAVIGKNRAAGDACVVGSVKANIGHLEAASGIAGLIKLALCLRHRSIPPLANLTTPNANIPFAELGLRLPLTLEPMPDGPGPACVSINSFGYGGTNAHAILQEYVPEPVTLVDGSDGETPSGDFHILPISARSKVALFELAKAYLERLGQPAAFPLHDLCYSAALRRGHHDQRLAVVATTREAMAMQLKHLIEQGTSAEVGLGSSIAKGQKPVFVFTGMGPQWWAMGRELFQREPVFRHAAEECDGIFNRLAGWSILAEMLADETTSRIAQTQIAQPANFVIQVGLAALWRSWGVEPAAVVGHSVGEVAAAYVAGILDLEDALLVAYHRSRIQKKAAGVGTMLAVGLSAADAAPYLAPHPRSISLAAANSPTSITLAGDTDILTQIAAQLQERGAFNRFLTVEVAYHSHLMDPLKPEIFDALAGLTVRPATIPIYSTVTGDLADKHAYDAAYWCRNVREPVHFEKAMASLIRDGHRLFLEVGPHPVLSTSIKECLAHHGVQGALLASLRRAKPERATLFEALAGLYIAGGVFDWKRFHAHGGNYIKLPAYPWQREAYWNESEVSYLDRVGRSNHALLGRRMNGPNPVWESVLNGNLLPYLPDHRVQELVILPGAAYVELGLAVHKEISGQAQFCLENLEFHKALIVENGHQPNLQVTYDGTTRQYAVFSREREDRPWNSHARGFLSFLPLGQAGRLSIEGIQARCTHGVDKEAHYEDMRARGLQYGPYFQGVRNLWLRPDGTEILALIEGHAQLAQSGHNNLLHPSLLDACFQSLLAGLAAKDDHNVYVPVSIRQVRLYNTPAGDFFCHSTFMHHQGSTLEGDVTLCDKEGNILAEVRGVRAQALTNKIQDELKDLDQWLYQFSWEKAPLVEASQGGGRWLVFCNAKGDGDQLASQLQTDGANDIVLVRPGETFRPVNESEYLIRPGEKEDYERLIVQTSSTPLRGMVYFWGLDASGDDVGTAQVVSVLFLIQALAQHHKAGPPRVFFITCQAQPVHSKQGEVAVAQAPIIGFVRVAINEFHEMRFRMVDFDRNADVMPRLAREIQSESREEEVALREDGRYVNRLVRRTAQDLAGGLDAGVSSFLAKSGDDAGASQSQSFKPPLPQPRRKPEPTEIEVALGLVSLTNQDTVPHGGTAAGGQPFTNVVGAEAFGVVVMVGKEVQTFKTGDRVMLTLQEPPRPFVTMPSHRVFRSKAFDDFGPSPAQLTNFVAAYHALHRVARLQRNERILIHAATSPLGLAAIQVAQWLKATIYVTAAGVEQRAYLQWLGLEHVFDSGSMEFIDRIGTLTDNRGLDVVLNSLTGEIANKTLMLLSPFGRFVSVHGWQRTEHALSVPLQANQSIAGLDIYQMIKQQPELFEQLAAEVIERFKADDLKPLPVCVIPAGQLGEALENGQARGSFGLNLLDFGDAAQRVALANQPSVERFDRHGTYLITGGFGGFGLEMAAWLVTQGVRNLVLVGRSGASTPEAQKAVQALRDAGAKVLPLAANISEEADIERLFMEIAQTMPPLKGVFHAAAVLDDGAIKLLSPSKFDAVMKPKARGAWLLHRYTRGMSLDYFVLFSSIGSMVGNPGQSPYVAANTFLDTLAHLRRAQNLPATSINWGALAQIGMAARQKGVEDYLNRMGFGSFTPTQAIKVLDKILDWKPVAIGAALMNWQVVRKSYPTWAEAPRNSIVMAYAGQDEAALAGPGPLQALSQLEPEERRKTVTGLFIELVSAILKIPQKKIDHSQSLLNLGMDSLMGIEIQASIEKKTGIKVSTLELMKGTSLTELIQHLVKMIDVSSAPGPVAKAEVAAAGPADTSRSRPNHLAEILSLVNIENLNSMLDNLSDAEVEQVLEKLLAKQTVA